MVQRRPRPGARTSTEVAFAFIASPVNSLLFEEVFMNDIRRTFLWVIFGFSMVLLWDQWQVYNGNKATFFPAPTAAPADKANAAATPSAAKDLPVASTAIASPNMAAGPSQVPVSANAPVATPLERIDVSTDVLKLSFDTEGGSLVRSEFLKFGELADNQKPFVLLDLSLIHI